VRQLRLLHVLEHSGESTCRTSLSTPSLEKFADTSVVTARDSTRDLCLLTAVLYRSDGGGKRDSSNESFTLLPAPPVARVAPLSSMKVGQRLYAIGAPQGLELSLSEGLVSGLRKDGDTTLIQTTAAISPGSSGGGLFDERGHLVGITTMFLKDSQALNFAVPAEMIALVPSVGNKGAHPAPSMPTRTPAPKLGATTSGDRWRTFYVDDTRALDVDTKTISRGDIVGSTQDFQHAVWIRARFSSPQNDGDGKNYVEDVRRYTFWCNSSDFVVWQVVQRNSEGEVIYSYKYSVSEIKVRSVVPDSIGEVIRDQACS